MTWEVAIDFEIFVFLNLDGIDNFSSIIRIVRKINIFEGNTC